MYYENKQKINKIKTKTETKTKTKTNTHIVMMTGRKKDRRYFPNCLSSVQLLSVFSFFFIVLCDVTDTSRASFMFSFFMFVTGFIVFTVY